MIVMKRNCLAKGVGLVEGVVAIAILVTGIISVVSLTLSNLSTSQGVEARLVGVNLAREGVEAVRSIRDGNWLKGYTHDTDPLGQDPLSWDRYLNPIPAADLTGTAIAVLDKNTLAWAIDFTPDAITSNAAKLRRDQNTKIYRQSTESPVPTGEVNTPYSRLITIYAICNNFPTNQETMDTVSCSNGWVKSGIRVVARVEWSESGRRAGVEAEEWLYNWRYSYAPYVP